MLMLMASSHLSYGYANYKDTANRIDDKPSSNLNVVIIGGGVAGMTTAVRLSAIPGLSVTLIEAESKLGGIFRTSFTAPGIYYPAKREDMRALDTLLGNTTIVDEFYADLKKVV